MDFVTADVPQTRAEAGVPQTMLSVSFGFAFGKPTCSEMSFNMMLYPLLQITTHKERIPKRFQMWNLLPKIPSNVTPILKSVHAMPTA